MKTITSKSQFNAVVKRIIGREESQREDVQNGYAWGIMQYATHGNATPLGNLYRACETSKVSGFTKLKRYIQDHNNVVYVNGKDDAGNECKIFKVRSGERATNVATDTTWFDYDSKGEKKPVKIGAVAKVSQAIKAIQKALDEDMLKGTADDAKNIINRLGDIAAKFED